MPIESLQGVSHERVPEVSKFVKYSDVAKKDPLQKLLTQNVELKAYKKAISKYEDVLAAAGETDEGKRAKQRIALLTAEQVRLEAHLKRCVLHKKQHSVYDEGVAKLESAALRRESKRERQRKLERERKLERGRERERG